MSDAPGPVLLWGEDVFLLREAALERLAGVQPVEIDARDWQGGETADLATPSLFGERRALLVTGCRALPEHALSELAAYLGAPAPDAQLVLVADVAERGKAPAALTKLMKGRGEVVEVNMGRRDLPGWVVERGRKHGLTVAPEGARSLVDALGESPAALDSALEQLRGAFPAERITRQQVQSQFQGLGDQRVWDLCDRMFARDVPGSIRSLRSLLDGREDALVVLGGIASRLRDLLRVKSLPERMPPADMAKAAGLRFDWQVRRYRDQARRFSFDELLRFHGRVVDADRDLKSGGQGDVVLAALVSSVAGD
ncbi:MAG: DNA polymerase III subunit delta [Actinomycetota bacterium]|nr:DNA polymerase III subunit delta [Actinomycetota bacterium]